MIDVALIIAGGEGKRMKASGIDTPKPLVKVNGKPLICYIIDSLVANDIKIVLVIEPWDKSFAEELKPRYPGIDLIFIKPPAKRKLLYDLLTVKPYIKNRFIMADADIIITPKVLKQFLKNDQESFCGIATVKRPQIQNNHYLKIENGLIKAFLKEGAENGYHGCMLYMFNPDFFKYVEAAISNNDFSFSNLITNIAKKEKVVPIYIKDLWDVDNYEDIVTTETYLKKIKKD